MRGEPDKTDVGVKLSAEPTRQTVKEILDQMEAEDVYRHPGLRCPKCGGMLAHYRLYGYRCMRGCQ